MRLSNLSNELPVKFDNLMSQIGSLEGNIFTHFNVLQRQHNCSGNSKESIDI